MTSPESCAGIVTHIREHVPGEKGQVMEYLIDMEHHYTAHPCQKAISDVIASLAVLSFSQTEFQTFVSRVQNPDLIVEAVLASVRSLLDERDGTAAESALSYILPYAEHPDEEGGKYRSFRDFIEYAYYITYVTPEQDFTVHPYLNCDILLQSGRLAALKGEKNRARAIFTSLSVLSPVNDSILFARADFCREEGNLDEFRNLTIHCFEYAWKPEDLAHAYRNMGYYLIETGDYTGAVTCYLMGTTWEDSTETARELAYIKEKSQIELDVSYILSHGREILDERNIPFGPNLKIIDLMVTYADECKQDGDFFEARRYLSRAKALELSDSLEREIEVIERFIEDNTIF
ncbi:hypothetical protein Mhun_1564 [Methanospirillum hungatei JF-1]|jgi:tetratricopeptide (TPR) repeat protein|uniref:Tetratricopeptide repeat protein n=1 Tax=Methanospirillum hungatei JF-1 (strain ATCC 27890 / DSM 864 / NBRC 100397 / JF-1) TaxID=323259 RepID=Q2FRE7_METHJ|nr:hypothetical protein [Methanospirillum hungatei]ABD41295.1 hypothetical protein Mhun_1564 [Methanospirillum hungatei JF-1]